MSSKDDEVDDARMPKRRKVLMRIIGSLGALGAAIVASPVIGFITAPAARTPGPRWRRVGRVSEFAIGATTMVTVGEPHAVPWAGPSGKQAVYLQRVGEEQFVAFSILCTHTACPVRWAEGARLFLCPCHGGAFHADGSVAGGPPTEPLPRHATRVLDGHVEVRLEHSLVRRRA